MNEEYIYNDIITNEDINELTKKYKMSELVRTYISIYGFNPPSHLSKKQDVINSLISYNHTMKRAKAFNQD